MTEGALLNALSIHLGATSLSLCNSLLGVNSYIDITLQGICLTILGLPKMSVFITYKSGTNFCSILQCQCFPLSALSGNSHHRHGDDSHQ